MPMFRSLLMAYNYSLLSYLMLPKPTESSPNPNEVREREPHSRLSALSNFSMGDLFKDVRDGPKSVRFPEKLLKVLEQKLQNIAMGKDAACAIMILIPEMSPLTLIVGTRTSLFAELWPNFMASSWWTASDAK